MYLNNIIKHTIPITLKQNILEINLNKKRKRNLQLKK